jgi:hypothetical protein
MSDCGSDGRLVGGVFQSSSRKEGDVSKGMSEISNEVK